MIEIDGSQGEGGGQIVRSSLALSLVTGKPFTIRRIRAGRAKPGLMRQHVTAARAARKISGATLSGAALGSTRFTFQPEAVQPGEYRFPMTTAGSATLVLQTVLPALMLADGPSSLVLGGGTHNSHAPPFEFLRDSYLPLLARIGPQVDVELIRPGFYPAGGGELTASIRPASRWQPFALHERGNLVEARVRAIVARLPQHIAERECATIAARVDWPPGALVVERAEGTKGPGNVVLLTLHCENVTTVFSGFGERGKPAEQVALEAWQQASDYLLTEAPVEPLLADQICLPLAISAHLGAGGGTFRTTALTAHARTHLDVIRMFLNVQIEVTDAPAETVEVRIRG